MSAILSDWLFAKGIAKTKVRKFNLVGGMLIASSLGLAGFFHGDVGAVALLTPLVTASTGMDAFIHSFESYISNKANPFSDMFALEGMRLISRSLLAAYHQGDNLEAREEMLLG